MGEATKVPDWATLVVSRTERHSIGVVYEVRLENDGADSGSCDLTEGQMTTVWRREVFFGATDATVAGGCVFREAAKEQDEVAERYAGALRSGGAR